MSLNTKIEWTDRSWNPIVGCSLESPGCQNCYAMKQAHRLSRIASTPQYIGTTRISGNRPVWTGQINEKESLFEKPLEWKRPCRIFVNSMGDLFHESVSLEQIQRVWDVMIEADWHTYQILTKRPERALELSGELNWPNFIWLGTSIESQDYIQRFKFISETPAQTKFISAEPLLAPLDFSELDDSILSQLDWIIVGGESGIKAREMKLSWVESIYQQLQRHDVKFFLKQMGKVYAKKNNLKDKKGGDVQEWDDSIKSIFSSLDEMRMFPYFNNVYGKDK